MTPFNRKCFKCPTILYYKTKWTLSAAEKKNTICKTCANKQISEFFKGKPLLESTKKKISDAMKGRPILWKDKMSKARKKFFKKNPDARPKGKKNPMFGKSAWLGKKHSIETLEKMRISSLNRTTPNFNHKACKYFDRLNKRRNWNLQHATNGGEIHINGYSLDAYDKQRNIAVEYDEPKHYDVNGNLRQKDITRQMNIIKSINCKFYRYNSITKKLQIV
jgi:hypothetical protein